MLGLFRIMLGLDPIDARVNRIMRSLDPIDARIIRIMWGLDPIDSCKVRTKYQHFGKMLLTFVRLTLLLYAVVDFEETWI